MDVKTKGSKNAKASRVNVKEKHVAHTHQRSRSTDKYNFSLVCAFNKAGKTLKFFALEYLLFLLCKKNKKTVKMVESN